MNTPPHEADSALGPLSEWKTDAPRPEISPAFSFEPHRGRDVRGSFRITCDQRRGLQGYWSRNFPVTGGRHYRVQAWHRETNVDCPRRQVSARVLWRDERNRPVNRDAPTITHYLPRWNPHPADAEYLEDGQTDAAGWTEAAGVYRAPSDATAAVVTLNFQWAVEASVEWSAVTFSEAEPPPVRKVRLATIHLEPRGGQSAEENCRLFEPYLAEASRQRADLVVLGEFITAQGRCPEVEAAEPIPGPSSEFLGELALRHDIHIVAGLVEREDHLIYNTAVLLGPDGKLLGKYRKVSLPTSEFERGVSPGDDYPVFATRFGRVGMMVCFDGFFPEVAQRLTMNGAEVIAWPVAGCNPLLAAARACENQVYVVSSSYGGPIDRWGISGVYGLEGNVIAHATEQERVAVAEVDFDAHIYWTGLGDWKRTLARQRPG